MISIWFLWCFWKLFGLQDPVQAAGALPVMHQVYQEVPQARVLHRTHWTYVFFKNHVFIYLKIEWEQSQYLPISPNCPQFWVIFDGWSAVFLLTWLFCGYGIHVWTSHIGILGHNMVNAVMWLSPEWQLGKFEDSGLVTAIKHHSIARFLRPVLPAPLQIRSDAGSSTSSCNKLAPKAAACSIYLHDLATVSQSCTVHGFKWVAALNV